MGAQQHEPDERTGMPIGLPRGVGVQQAAGSADGVVAADAARGVQQALASVTSSPAPSPSRNTGMFPSVWKCSHAMPCGSVTQCFSLRA